MSRIFVYIAAYRDPECEPTIRDLFEMAVHPNDISVGLCWQFFPGIDDHLLPLSTRRDQVRLMEVDAKQSRGLGWPRLQAQKFWQGEEYALQIDSHMRFEPGWDEKLIDQLARCGSKKAILSGYPTPYTPPRNLSPLERYVMAASHFTEDGILLFGSFSAGANNSVPAPVPGMFCSGGFVFGSSSFLQEVPYDPYIYFYGDEISLSVRLWTHGYDIYHPCENAIYHYYKEAGDTTNRTHWADNEDWYRLNAVSLARVKYLLTGELPTTEDALREIETYGLGTERSIAEYEALSGVDFKNRTISDNARLGIFGTPNL